MRLPRYASAAVRPHAHTRVTREGYPSNETFATAAECVDYAGPGAGTPMLGAYFTWQPSPQSGAIRMFWRRLKDAGKPWRVALVAWVRRLLTTLNAVLRSSSAWRPFAVLTT